MYRYTLTLPLADNLGNPVPEVHFSVRRMLLHEFGGLTERAVSGAWKSDDGTIYSDDSIEYVTDSDREDAFTTVERIARIAAYLAKQECVYVSCHEVTTALVQPVPATETVAS